MIKLGFWHTCADVVRLRAVVRSHVRGRFSITFCEAQVLDCRENACLRKGSSTCLKDPTDCIKIVVSLRIS